MFSWEEDDSYAASTQITQGTQGLVCAGLQTVTAGYEDLGSTVTLWGVKNLCGLFLNPGPGPQGL